MTDLVNIKCCISYSCKNCQNWFIYVRYAERQSSDIFGTQCRWQITLCYHSLGGTTISTRLYSFSSRHTLLKCSHVHNLSPVFSGRCLLQGVVRTDVQWSEIKLNSSEPRVIGSSWGSFSVSRGLRITAQLYGDGLHWEHYVQCD